MIKKGARRKELEKRAEEIKSELTTLTDIRELYSNELNRQRSERQFLEEDTERLKMLLEDSDLAQADVLKESVRLKEDTLTKEVANLNKTLNVLHGIEFPKKQSKKKESKDSKDKDKVQIKRKKTKLENDDFIRELKKSNLEIIKLLTKYEKIFSDLFDVSPPEYNFKDEEQGMENFEH